MQFDADGNMIAGPLNGQMSSYTYDSRNRLVTAGNLTYEYDAENNRVGVTENSGGSPSKTDYVVNPHAALSQVLIKTVGNEKTYYVYGLGLIGQEVAGEYSTYHFDLRGSTVAITDVSGKVTDRYQYSAYGELLSSTGDTDTPFLFNGRDGVVTDGNGLYYMRARYYNPEIRRFVSQDLLLGVVIDGQSLNRYAYVQGNPVGFVDPLGLARDGWGQNTWSKDFSGHVRRYGSLNKDKNGFSKWLEEIGITLSIGLNLSGSAGVQGAETGVISIDTKGNIAIQRTKALGMSAGTPGGSFTAIMMVTNAPEISKLEETSYQMGGSGGALIGLIPASAGGELVIIPDQKTGKKYGGITMSGGLGFPGAEGHFERGVTETVWKVNVFDFVKNTFNKIMGR